MYILVWDIDQLKPLSATMILYWLRAFADLRHHQVYIYVWSLKFRKLSFIFIYTTHITYRLMAVYNPYWKEIKSTLFKSLIYNRLSTNQIKSCRCWFLVRGENRNTSHSRVENQQTQSTYDAECGNRTRAILVEGKCSHHLANHATGLADSKSYVDVLSKS